MSVDVDELDDLFWVLLLHVGENARDLVVEAVDSVVDTASKLGRQEPWAFKARDARLVDQFETLVVAGWVLGVEETSVASNE